MDSGHNKKKILFFTALNFGYAISGMTRMIDFSKYLISKGNEVKIILSSPEEIKDKESFIVREEFAKTKYSPKTILGMLERITGVLTCSWRIRKIIKREKPDIIICQYLQLMLALKIATLGSRCRLIFDFGDPVYERMHAYTKNKLILFLTKIYENFIYKRTKHFIVTMEHYKQFLIDKGIKESRITTVPFGLNLSLYDVEGYKKEKKKLANKTVFIYSGYLGAWFDIPKFIEKSAEFLKNHKDVCFVFSGPAYKEVLKDISGIIKKNKLGDSVLILPPALRSEFPKYIKMADFGITIVKDDIVSFWDSVPSKTLDYLACGRPGFFYLWPVWPSLPVLT